MEREWTMNMKRVKILFENGTRWNMTKTPVHLTTATEFTNIICRHRI